MIRNPFVKNNIGSCTGSYVNIAGSVGYRLVGHYLWSPV